MDELKEKPEPFMGSGFFMLLNLNLHGFESDTITLRVEPSDTGHHPYRTSSLHTSACPQEI